MKNLWREHIDYLKDNPEGYWFKRKLYGWGWVPATREGWLVTLLFVLLILGVVILSDPESKTDTEVLTTLFPKVGILIIIFIVISYIKGEKLRWQWGNKRDASTIEEEASFSEDKNGKENF